MRKDVKNCRAGYAPITNPQELMLIEQVSDFFEIHADNAQRKIKKELVSPELLEFFIFRCGFRVHFQNKYYVLEKVPEE